MSNEEVWRRTNQEPINIIIKRRNWKWIGHILRKPQDDIISYDIMSYRRLENVV
jgi:hypothetical protein